MVDPEQTIYYGSYRGMLNCDSTEKRIFFWIILRAAAIIIMSITLTFCFTNLLGKILPTTIFTATGSPVPISAGIGPFNASWAADWNPSVLDLFVVSQVPVLAVDILQIYPTIPISNGCVGPSCKSRFFSGGIGFVAPSPFLTMTQPTQSDVFIVHGEQGLQGDFWSVNSVDATITSNDCRTYGFSASAFTICIKPSSLYDTALVAGCPSGC